VVASTAFPSGSLAGMNEIDYVIPGSPIEQSPFEEISTNLTTPSDIASYREAYDIKSEKPFIISVDLHDAPVVSENEAKIAATYFIENSIDHNAFVQLEIDDRAVEIYGILPRWRIPFKNSTITTHTKIETTVFINAISGGVMGYSGLPIIENEPVDNVSVAETTILHALNHFGFAIPSSSRYIIEKHSDMETILYSFTLHSVVNNVIVDSSFGSLNIQIDAENGAVTFMMVEWMEISSIPTEGVLPSDRFAPNATLSLQSVPEEGQNLYDTNIEAPLNMQLVWMERNVATNEETLYDAFTGEIVRYESSLGNSNEDSRLLFLSPIIGALGVSLVAYVIGKKQFARRIIIR
jgi:hypothetical protein